MSAVRFHKVATLPGTLEANALYFVENGTFSESYLTDDTGTARSLGNSAMIQAVVSPMITAALADLNMIEIAATIAARDALTKGRSFLVMVQDATGDPTVSSGAALYVYSEGANAFYKLAEYESMDITLSWSALQGKPTSSPSTIDDAVSKRHSHTNKATLDKLGEASGKLTFDGTEVGGSSANWNTVNW